MKGDIVFGGPDSKSLATNIFFYKRYRFPKTHFWNTFEKDLKGWRNEFGWDNFHILHIINGISYDRKIKYR